MLIIYYIKSKNNLLKEQEEEQQHGKIKETNNFIFVLSCNHANYLNVGLEHNK